MNFTWRIILLILFALLNLFLKYFVDPIIEPKLEELGRKWFDSPGVPRRALRISWIIVAVFIVLIIISSAINIILEVAPDPADGAGSTANSPTLISTRIATQKPTITISESHSPISTNTPSSTPTQVATCKFMNGQVQVGIYDLGSEYEYADIFDRLSGLGMSIDKIDTLSNYDVLKDYDVIFFPPGWGEKYHNILLKDTDIERYVSNGGGLFIGQPDMMIELTEPLVPYEISISSDKWNGKDWANIVNNFIQTDLVNGFIEDELPVPMNCMEFEDYYTPIVQGSESGCMSLAITRSKNGRILLNMGNISPSMEEENLPTISDDFVCQMFRWVTGEID